MPAGCTAGRDGTERDAQEIISERIRLLKK